MGNRFATFGASAGDCSVDLVRGAFEQNFVSLQETLRRVVRKAIEDPTFAATFDTDGDIRWRHREAVAGSTAAQVVI
jgi:hypothetical protein